MRKHFRIGCTNTRTGRLQAEQVAHCIKPSGYSTEILPLYAAHELDHALLNQAVDIAVSSATALGSATPEELELIAFTKRKTVNDVVVSKANRSLNEHIRVAATSERRLAFTRHYYPNALATHDPDLEHLAYDAWVMGYEEAVEGGFEPDIIEQIETSYFTPAAGEGSCVVKCHKKLDYPYKEVLQLWVNHEETEDCIRAERIFLHSIPPAANLLPFSYAHFEGALITLKAGFISKDGKELFKAKKSAALGESRALGKRVALEVIRLISEQQLQVG